MTTYDPLSLPADTLTPDDRRRAEEALRHLHTEGLIDTGELNQRMGQVFMAESPLDLTIAVRGPLPVLPAAPVHAQVLAPAGRTPVGTGTGLAVLAHVSVFFAWLFGPVIMWAISAKGSYARREAAKAFNFQLTWFIGTIVGGIVTGIVTNGNNGWFMQLWGILWVILTVMGAVKAARGEDWTNPVKRIAPWEALREQQR